MLTKRLAKKTPAPAGTSPSAPANPYMLTAPANLPADHILVLWTWIQNLVKISTSGSSETDYKELTACITTAYLGAIAAPILALHNWTARQEDNRALVIACLEARSSSAKLASTIMATLPINFENIVAGVNIVLYPEALWQNYDGTATAVVARANTVAYEGGINAINNAVTAYLNNTRRLWRKITVPTGEAVDKTNFIGVCLMPNLLSVKIDQMPIREAVEVMFIIYDRVDPVKRTAQIKTLSENLLSTLLRNPKNINWNPCYKYMLDINLLDGVEADLLHVKTLIAAALASDKSEKVLWHRTTLL